MKCKNIILSILDKNVNLLMFLQKISDLYQLIDNTRLIRQNGFAMCIVYDKKSNEDGFARVSSEFA